MSLYQLQKFLFDINRDEALQRQCREDVAGILSRYELSDEERGALEAGGPAALPPGGSKARRRRPPSLLRRPREIRPH